jgi:hypothetical protein
VRYFEIEGLHGLRNCAQWPLTLSLHCREKFGGNYEGRGYGVDVGMLLDAFGETRPRNFARDLI